VSVRGRLPQLGGETFITDGGMETTLIFHAGLELPLFASFVLLDDEAGERALREYFDRFVAIARERGVGLVLDAPTWRASADWGAQLGYTPDALDRVNRRGVALLERVRTDAGDGLTIVLSGAVGPRRDAYLADDRMSADEAEQYHHDQLATFADTSVDLATAYTLTNAAEAIGIVRAAYEVSLPVAISFTVETDGRLPDGQPLREAIEEVDTATDSRTAYFLINCAHPSHFADVLPTLGETRERIHGLRANASSKSHAELDESETLDDGDPAELAAGYASLRQWLPSLNIVGGCCGTDHRHIAAICETWTSSA
jgi:S-methylmethionine-dependent homocysteine/selenocysteine methylase